MAEHHDRSGRRLVLLVPYLWLLVFFLVPFLIVLKISFSQIAVAMPPYTPTFSLSQGWDGFVAAFRQLSFDNYVWLTEDDLYIRSYLSSVWIAFVSTIITLLVGYPVAYGMARAPSQWRARSACHTVLS